MEIDIEGFDFFKVAPDFSGYLRDESRLYGSAETINFPQTEEDVKHTLKRLSSIRSLVTIQGARTGITGGAVPAGGHILNLSKMNRFLGMRFIEEQNKYALTVQPGVLLEEINLAVGRQIFETSAWNSESLRTLDRFKGEGAFFFPPDSTETSASIGGMAANNASGACSFLYGPTRNHIQALRVVLPDGSGLVLERGFNRAKAGRFKLETDSGTILAGQLPGYPMPAVKNVAGYYVRDDMDMLDLFIGSEGTLGVITQMDILLSSLPAEIWGIMVFFAEEKMAVKFVRSLRGDSSNREQSISEKPAAIEFFDQHALELLRQQKIQNSAFSELPEIPGEHNTAIYVEYHAPDEQSMEDMVFKMTEAIAGCGGDDEATWMASNTRDLERLKNFRHALPEAINLLIDERRKSVSGLTKPGTDMAVPDGKLEKVIEMYESDLSESGLEYVKFGHIGDNHIHINILPQNLQHYEAGRALHKKWAEAVAAMNGTVSAEHGIGKLKVQLLKIMYGQEDLQQMCRLMQIFNPHFLLNRGNSVLC
ncbi:MAG: FAD-binding protein [Spirochaeta sp.]|nr:FAD-binding protein [Spirochaeta sp.]